MKKIIHPGQLVPWFILTIILCCTLVWGQEEHSGRKKKIFLRVYGLDQKIIAKGKLANLSDSVIVLSSIKEGEYAFDTVHYARISFIRKGKSPMHYFVTRGLLTFAIATPMLAYGEATKTASNVATNGLAYAIAGSPMPEPEPSHAIRNGILVGILVGGCSALAHSENQIKIRVDGSYAKFKFAKQDVLIPTEQF
jgi:hypothetical protein